MKFGRQLGMMASAGVLVLGCDAGPTETMVIPDIMGNEEPSVCAVLPQGIEQLDNTRGEVKESFSYLLSTMKQSGGKPINGTCNQNSSMITVPNVLNGKIGCDEFSPEGVLADKWCRFTQDNATKDNINAEVRLAYNDFGQPYSLNVSTFEPLTGKNDSSHFVSVICRSFQLDVKSALTIVTATRVNEASPVITTTKIIDLCDADCTKLLKDADVSMDDASVKALSICKNK